MATVVTQRANGSNGETTGNQTFTSASFTPAANSLLYVWACAENDTHTATQDWSISNTGGLTFTRIEHTAQVLFDGNNQYQGRAALFEAPVGGSPSAMTVTVDPYAAATNFAWMSLAVFDVTGGTLKQHVSNAEEDARTSAETHTTGTLGATTVSGNPCVLCVGKGNDTAGATSAPAGGWTEAVGQSQTYTSVSVFTNTAFVGTSVTITDLGEAVGQSFSALLEFEDASGTTTRTQSAFRWRNDDGSETTATWRAAENAAP